MEVLLRVVPILEYLSILGLHVHHLKHDGLELTLDLVQVWEQVNWLPVLIEQRARHWLGLELDLLCAAVLNFK
jgi:hypothetical protein